MNSLLLLEIFLFMLHILGGFKLRMGFLIGVDRAPITRLSRGKTIVDMTSFFFHRTVKYELSKIRTVQFPD